MKKTATPRPEGRFEFSPATKKRIADRAAYRCVVPGCKNPTIGPGASQSEVALTGTASHIYSAAKDGPRGRNGLLEEDIKDIENGVWCCGNHGRLIDTNRGDAYPAILLKSWRKLQESQLRWEMDHQPTSTGWFQQIRIHQSFLFHPDVTLPFSKCTIIHGSWHGKTALCDWIGTSAGLKVPERWANAPGPMISTLAYFSPTEHALELVISGTHAGLKLDGVGSPEPPRDLSIVSVTENYWEEIHGAEDADVGLAKALQVDRTVIRRLEEDIHRNGTLWGRTLCFSEEEEQFDDDEERPKFPRRFIVLRRNCISFAGMSTGERTLVVVEFAAALARTRAKRCATLLTLDGSGWTLDDGNLTSLAKYLERQPFQVLLTRHNGWKPENIDQWRNWSRLRLFKRGNAADIEVDPWLPATTSDMGP